MQPGREEYMNVAIRHKDLPETPCEWESEHLSHLSVHILVFRLKKVGKFTAVYLLRKHQIQLFTYLDT